MIAITHCTSSFYKYYKVPFFTEFQTSKSNLSKSKEKISPDGAEEKLLPKEEEAKIVTRVDMADAKYVVEDHRNGDAKIELDANKRVSGYAYLIMIILAKRCMYNCTLLDIGPPPAYTTSHVSIRPSIKYPEGAACVGGPRWTHDLIKVARTHWMRQARTGRHLSCDMWWSSWSWFWI